MMTLRARIFIILTVVVLVLLSVTLFLVVRNRNKTAVPTVPVNTNTTLPTTIVQTPNNQLPPNKNQIVVTQPAVIKDPLAIEQAAVQQIARVFIERYQTYSNQNNYENIKQIQTLVTPALWKKLSARLSTPQAAGVVSGATTISFAQELKAWDATAATVFVQTRRDIQKNGASDTVNQNYTVKMVKVGSDWLADSFSAE